MKNILLVCTGNICRSPTAEGVLRAQAQARGIGHLFYFDSAGTFGYHTGEPPDSRSIRIAATRGVDIASLRARKVCSSDFERFDLLLGMDSSHVKSLLLMAPPNSKNKVIPFDCKNVEDPYYGDDDGFLRVLSHIERRSHELLSEWSVALPAINHDGLEP